MRHKRCPIRSPDLAGHEHVRKTKSFMLLVREVKKQPSPVRAWLSSILYGLAKLIRPTGPVFMLSMRSAWNMPTRDFFTTLIWDMAFLYLWFINDGIVSHYALNFLITFFIWMNRWAALMRFLCLFHWGGPPPGYVRLRYNICAFADVRPLQMPISNRKGACRKRNLPDPSYLDSQETGTKNTQPCQAARLWVFCNSNIFFAAIRSTIIS